MKNKFFLLLASIFLISFFVSSQIPKKELLKRVSIPSQKGLRGLVDLVGFSHSREQIEYVVNYLEKKRRKKYSRTKKNTASLLKHL